MRVQAGGQSRFHGWNQIVDYSCATVNWVPVSTPKSQVTITSSHINLQLNGEYKVEVTITDEDIKALIPQLLWKHEIVSLCSLTDTDKIEMAKGVLAKPSTNDKPDIKTLFSLVEAMLDRKQVIALLKLSEDEKLELAREVLMRSGISFSDALKRLAEPEKETLKRAA
jgi:hypothetical protein